MRRVAARNARTVCAALQLPTAARGRSLSSRSNRLDGELKQAEQSIAQLDEIKTLDKLAAQGKFSNAVPLALRAQQIFANVPDPVLNASVQLRLSRLHRNNGNFAQEATVRAAVVRALDNRPDKDTDATYAGNVFSLAIALMRAGRAGEAVALCEQHLGRFRSSGHAEAEAQSALLLGLARYTALAGSSEGGGSGSGADSEASRRAEQQLKQAVEVAAAKLSPTHLFVGDARMALGAFYRRHRRDAAAAQSELSQALQLFEQHDTGVVNEHLPAAEALALMGGVDHAKGALKLTEEKVGADSWLVGDRLRSLAGEFHAAGDAVSAEGLFRSAVARLSQQPIKTPEVQFALCDTLVDFAFLFSQMTWNNKSRSREALDLLSRVDAVHAAMPSLALPTAAGAWLNRTYNKGHVAAMAKKLEAAGFAAAPPPGAKQQAAGGSSGSSGNGQRAEPGLDSLLPLSQQPRLELWTVQRFSAV